MLDENFRLVCIQLSYITPSPPLPISQICIHQNNLFIFSHRLTIHSINNYFLSVYYVPGSVGAVENSSVLYKKQELHI